MAKSQITVILGAIILVIGYMSVFVVDERQLAMKFRFGEIVKSDYEPGLYFLVPFFNNAQVFDARIQTVDAPPERYLTGEKKNVIVDAFIKWRIIDIPTYYRTTQKGNQSIANDRLSTIVNDALKNQISQLPVKEVISEGRNKIMQTVREQVDKEARGLGITVVDVRIKKLDYSEEISQSVYKRMIAERQTVAKQLRSEGEEEAKKIRATAEREREEILAEAYRQAQTIRGDGDAKSAEIYAKAYGRDPEFYNFYRSLTAYRKTFAGRQDLLILEPDSEFFRYFNNARGRAN